MVNGRRGMIRILAKKGTNEKNNDPITDSICRC